MEAGGGEAFIDEAEAELQSALRYGNEIDNRSPTLHNHQFLQWVDHLPLCLPPPLPPPQPPPPPSALERKKRKYIKRSIVKFLDSSTQPFSTLSRRGMQYASRIKLQVTPLYPSITEIESFILIGGDFAYWAKSPYSEEESRSRVPQVLQQYKEIVEIKKTGSGLWVKLHNKREGLVDFRQLIGQINAQMSSISGQDHIELLLRFQASLKFFHESVERIIAQYSANPEELLAIQRKRIDYIYEFGRSRLEREKYDEAKDFLVVGLSMVNFSKKTPVIEYIVMNKRIVDLIGQTQEQTQSYILRKGLREFFDLHTQAMMLNYQVAGFNQLVNNVFEVPFRLITYDDIFIPCKMQIQVVFVEMPPHLRYDKAPTAHTNLIENSENLFYFKIDVSEEQVRYVQSLRNLAAKDAAAATTEMNDELIAAHSKETKRSYLRMDEELGYTVQTQLFLDKFYEGQLGEINQNRGGCAEADTRRAEELEEELKKVLDKRTCKFKSI